MVLYGEQQPYMGGRGGGHGRIFKVGHPCLKSSPRLITHSLAAHHHVTRLSGFCALHLPLLLLFSCPSLLSCAFTLSLQSPPGSCSQDRPKQGKQRGLCHNFGTQIPLREVKFNLPYFKLISLRKLKAPTPILVITIATTP